MKPILFKQEIVDGEVITLLAEPWPYESSISKHLLEMNPKYIKVDLPMIYINVPNGYAAYKVVGDDLVGHAYKIRCIEMDHDLPEVA